MNFNPLWLTLRRPPKNRFFVIIYTLINSTGHGLVRQNIHFVLFEVFKVPTITCSLWPLGMSSLLPHLHYEWTADRDVRVSKIVIRKALIFLSCKSTILWWKLSKVSELKLGWIDLVDWISSQLDQTRPKQTRTDKTQLVEGKTCSCLCHFIILLFQMSGLGPLELVRTILMV